MFSILFDRKTRQNDKNVLDLNDEEKKDERSD